MCHARRLLEEGMVSLPPKKSPLQPKGPRTSRCLSQLKAAAEADFERLVGGASTPSAQQQQPSEGGQTGPRTGAPAAVTPRLNLAQQEARPELVCCGSELHISVVMAR